MKWAKNQTQFALEENPTFFPFSRIILKKTKNLQITSQHGSLVAKVVVNLVKKWRQKMKQRNKIKVGKGEEGAREKFMQCKEKRWMWETKWQVWKSWFQGVYYISIYFKNNVKNMHVRMKMAKSWKWFLLLNLWSFLHRKTKSIT